MKNATELLDRVRFSIDQMRKYKRDNRLIGSIRVFVGEDLIPDLTKTGQLISDPCGEYTLDNYPVYEVKGYPKGYFAVE